jgi:hypothetical protein
MLDMHDEQKENCLPHFELTRTIFGLLINFRRRKLNYQKLHQSEVFKGEEEAVEESIPF